MSVVHCAGMDSGYWQGLLAPLCFRLVGITSVQGSNSWNCLGESQSPGPSSGSSSEEDCAEWSNAAGLGKDSLRGSDLVSAPGGPVAAAFAL